MPKAFIRNYLLFTLILLTCMVGLGYVLVSGDRQIEKSDKWVLRTHEVIIISEQLNTLISSMLSSQRGYIISANEKFLEEYEEKKAAVSRHIANLSDLTAGNPSQQSRLQEIRQYFSSFSEQLEMRVAGTLESEEKEKQKILADVESVNRLKSDIVRVNGDFLEEEYMLLNQQIKAVEKKKDQYLLTLLIGGSIAVVLLMLFNAYLLRVQSKRSAAEIALGEQEEIFRLAIEGTQDGVFDWNIKTGDVFYSEQFIAMLGYEPSDFKGTADDFFSRLHPDEKQDVQEHIDLYMDGQLSEYDNTFRMKSKSGRWIWINSRAKMIKDDRHHPVRMVGAHTDVSAAKEYEQRLQDAKTKAEEASRAKSDFLAHMSHEIRTPLTTISGAAEILSQNKEGFDEKKQKLVEVLNSSALTLKDLIADVLDFSKIESGELELEESAFDLVDAFEHIVSIMAVRATEKKLGFRVDYESVKDLRFYGDSIRIRQILINLIGNAIKFTEEGHVFVRVSNTKKAHAPVLQIDVEDTGIGIGKDQFDLVFERFKQADASVSRKYGGTGLGLPISKKLAHLMGGDIQVDSTLGKGSTFSLILPLRLAEDTAPEKRYDTAHKRKLNDKLRAAIRDTDKILIVEDYEGNVVVLSYLMEEMGCRFDVARTGLEAVNLWNKSHYDVILMDIQMPEMDGFTATKQIRMMEEEKNLDRTPIIGMTAHALVGDKDKCIECGMDAYLPKPIVDVDLKSTMLKFLKKSKKAA